MNPAEVMARLEEIEQDVAVRQNAFESAAAGWFLAKRDKEHRRAVEFIKASGTVAERNAIADRETALMGRESEAEYEALRGVLRALDTRASIGMALMKSMGRGA